MQKIVIFGLVPVKLRIDRVDYPTLRHRHRSTPCRRLAARNFFCFSVHSYVHDSLCISFSIVQYISIAIPIATSSKSLNHLPDMSTELHTTNGIAANGDSSNQQSVKEGLARMLKGGVIMDVVNAEQ